MKRKRKIILICLVLSLLGISSVTYLYLNSASIESFNAVHKISKFPGIKDVESAKIRLYHLGPGKPDEITTLYFDLNLSEHKKAVAKILNLLNEDSVQIKEAEKQEFFGYGGYNPRFLSIKFKDGTSYDILLEGEEAIINGYAKDKSIVVSNCPELIKFIGFGLDDLKKDMKPAIERSFK